MKKLICLIFLIISTFSSYSQCNTGNATTCVCADGSIKCKLLPDITIGRKMLMDPNTYTEYSQTGNGVENGRLRISVATPNIGHGPLTVMTTTTFVCGTDTFYGTSPGTCPNGDAPKQLINQRVFSKKGKTMSYYDRPAGTMTYHPTHQHMHVDDWGIYTLRIATLDPNPLNWPIVGTGAKLAFCLMDLSTCTAEFGNCVNDKNDTLVNTDFPNYGLGGGQYTCSPVVQGISSGFVDYYDQTLDGMWINIPPGTCNGDYWIVTQIDPYNYFDEENENNNIVATPITLKKQTPFGTGGIIANLGAQTICNGGTTTLQANLGTTYLWSNGATTQTIVVSASGTYMVTVDGFCGVTTSPPYTVSMITPAVPTAQNSYFIAPASTTVSATGTGKIDWYDASSGGNFLGTGNVFTTGVLNNTTTFYAENIETQIGLTAYAPPSANTIGGGANHTDQTRFLTFDAYKDFMLQSVKVYATGAGNRLIELRDGGGGILDSVTAMVPSGESRITLNFQVAKGSNYQLGVGSTPNFFRNNSGVQFPYNVSGMLDITSSSAGASYYYFFYDWEVKENDIVCNSSRVPATAFNSTTGITNNINSVVWNTYPNPASGYLTVELPSLPENSKLELIDVTGKKVWEQNIGSTNKPSIISIDVTKMSAGTYSLKIENEKISERKILIIE